MSTEAKTWPDLEPNTSGQGGVTPIVKASRSTVRWALALGRPSDSASQLSPPSAVR